MQTRQKRLQLEGHRDPHRDDEILLLNAMDDLSGHSSRVLRLISTDNRGTWEVIDDSNRTRYIELYLDEPRTWIEVRL